MGMLTVVPGMTGSRRLEESSTNSATSVATISSARVLKRGQSGSPTGQAPFPPHIPSEGSVCIIRRHAEGPMETLQRIERLLHQRLGDIDAKLEGIASKAFEVIPPFGECSHGQWTHEPSTPRAGTQNEREEEMDTPVLPCAPDNLGDVRETTRVPTKQSFLSATAVPTKAMDRQHSLSEVGSSHVDEFPLSPNLKRVHSSTSLDSKQSIRSGNGQRERNACRMRIQTFLEEPSSSCVATIYSRLMFLFIMVSVCMPLLQTLKRPLMSDVDSLMFEMASDLIFVTEVVVRWFTYPGCVGFLLVPYNILDLCVAGPLVLRTFLGLGVVKEGLFSQMFLFCIVPVLRLLKALRTFPNLKLVYYALSIAREALTVPLFLLLVLTLVFSSLFFLIEPRENIETMPHAMWFVIVTVTTVGYGDVSPETIAGKLVASVLSVTGVLYMAMPLTIVGAAFDYTWKNRDAIILGGLMQQRMNQWGLSEADLDLMFRHFDDDGSGELGVAEFTAMLEEMQLGLSTKSILQIFKAFDRDGSGSVKFGELAHWIFPGVIVEEL